MIYKNKKIHLDFDLSQKKNLHVHASAVKKITIIYNFYITLRLITY